MWKCMPAVLTVCLVAGADSAKTEGKKLQGTWEMVSGEHEGEKIADEDVKAMSMVIEGDKCTVKTPEDTFKGTFKLDPTKKPKTIDSTDGEGKTWLGIYELKGDEYRICAAAPGKDRPKDFASGDYLSVWKRVKK